MVNQDAMVDQQIFDSQFQPLLVSKSRPSPRNAERWRLD